MKGQTKCISRDPLPKNKCQEGEADDQVKETRAVLDLFKGWKFFGRKIDRVELIQLFYTFS